MLATIVCASEQKYLKNIKTKTISLCILSITITIYKKSQKLAWISIATNILFKRPYIKSIAYVLDSECHAKAYFIIPIFFGLCINLRYLNCRE